MTTPIFTYQKKKIKHYLITFNLNLMCSCNSNGKNHTSNEVKEFMLKNKDAHASGIGFFLVPDPESGIYDFKKVFVKDIGFTETAKRGLNCEAFKFLPYGIELQHPDKGNVKINSIADLDNFECRFIGCAGGYGPDCWASHCYCTYYNGCI